MKKVINGKRYNSESAQRIAEHDSDFPVSDFRYWKETLYKKQTGEFFLHGEGNGLSKYAQSYGDSMGQGEKLIPLTLEEAKEWAEHLEADKYEEIFEAEDEMNSTINMLIPVSLHDKLRQASEESGRSQKDIVVSALKKYL